MADDPTRPIAKLLDRLVEVGKSARKPFVDARTDIYRYAYDRTFDFMYQDGVAADAFFKAKIAKAAEFVEIMGSSLYPMNPEVAVTDFEWTTPLHRVRHRVEKQYADYSFRLGNMQSHGTKATYEALLSGRGVLWTGFNARKGIVQSVYDHIENLIVDPDARITEEINWIGRKRIKPRWSLVQQFPEQKEAIARLDKSSDRPSDTKNTTFEPASELIEYWEIYARVPLTNYGPNLLGSDALKGIELGDGPMKFTFAKDVLLKAETWEIPFHQDDCWPCEWFDPLECGDKLWPVSPLETGMGHLRALNWIYTLYLSKMRVTTRTPLVVANYNGQGMKDDEVLKIIAGKDFDVVRLNVQGEMIKLSDLVQQFKFDTGVEEFERFSNIVSTAFEKATGLYEVMYTGTTPTQIRNATTADMIRNASQSRVMLMQQRMEGFMSRITRKTLLAARFLHSPEDIGKLFGPEAAANWGMLAPQEMVVQERQMRQQTKQMLGQQMMLQSQQPIPGPMGPMPPPPIDPKQMDAQLEQQLGPEQLVSMEEWLHESDRTIVTGSMRPINPQAQVDNLNVALNQLAPAVVALPGGAALVAAIAVEFAQKNKYSLDLIEAAKQFQANANAVTQAQVQQAMMPPPAPEPPQGTPPKGPQSGPDGGHNQQTG